ncbi:Type 1 glutamine amidotransferase-like domain-containing protein [Candidatus Bathyarchaeota archaeon]|nr:Type 1 glutamine amidotransferase-like domain-containing protein [Candidatus Bathyarchaeota archaeon]
MTDNVIEVNEDTINRFLKQNHFAVVDFWSPMCGPCNDLAPVLKELADEYKGKCFFGKMNVGKDNSLDPYLRKKYLDDQGVPVLLFFKDGKRVDRILGYYPETTPQLIREKINNMTKPKRQIMKLLLTSAGMHTPQIRETLKDLYGKPAEKTKILIISTDTKTEGYQKSFEIEKQQLAETGVKPQNVVIYDLAENNPPYLKEYDVVFVYVGNTYKYMKMIRETGLFVHLRDYIEGGGVYVGVSAGSVLACPDIDNNFILETNTDVGLTDLSGLDLVDFYIVVHWEHRDQEKIMAYSKYTCKRIIPITNDEAVLVIDGKCQKIQFDSIIDC